MVKRRHRRRWLAVLAVLVLAGLAGLGSPLGLRLLTPRLEARLSALLGAPVQLDGLRLSRPLGFRIARLRVADGEQTYLDVRRASVRVAVRPLWRGKLEFRRLHARHLTFNGWPASQTAEPALSRDEPPALPDLRRLAEQLIIDRFRIDELVLGSDLLATPARFAVDARFRPIPGGREGWFLVEAVFANGTTGAQRTAIFELETEWRLESLDRLFIPFRVMAEGWAGQLPFWAARAAERATVTGSIRITGTEQLALESLRIDMAPVTVTGAGRWELPQRRLGGAFELESGGGRLQAAGHATPSELDLSVSLDGASPAAFGYNGHPLFRASWDGRLTLTGHPGAPVAEAELHGRDLILSDHEFWIGPPAQLVMNARLAEQRLTVDGALSGLTHIPVAWEGQMPMDLAFAPFRLEWPPDGAWSGRLRSESDLSEWAALMLLDVHHISGRLDAELRLAGTVDAPDIAGHLRVRDGRYEHDGTGTLLRDIQLDFSGEGNRLAIERFSATDGGRGVLDLQGSLELDADQDYPFEARLDLDALRLMHNERASAVGSGHLEWSGTHRVSRAEGRIEVASADLNIPERTPAALITLEVTELDPPAEAPVEDPPVAGIPHELELDIGVNMHDRFFVRGRGLDSEWSGALRIRGPLSDPVVTGSLSILRGRLIFFGRRLALTRGIITLDGSVPVAPTLDIVAETRSGGITALLRLTGTVDAPEIELASQPVMPEDEILARLLFGREAARITPWQALTMAQAIRQLRGGGHTFDLMGATRRRLGVDQVELRESEEEDGPMTVSVGKYVSDRVYVELERSMGEESGRAVVEVELTPNIRMETETGTDRESGLGLIWTWDY